VIERLPEGQPLYPEDAATDQTVEERLAELVREQALRRTREEAPHSIAVVIEELDREDDLTRVYATIVVERDSQKGILIGKGGEMLRAIGIAARAEIQPLLGTRVYLDLRVKVLKEWQRDPKALNRLGL
jgi:GTPase